MFNLFDLELISVILNRFKVKKILISSLYYDEVLNEILKQYQKSEVSITLINPNYYLNNIDSNTFNNPIDGEVKDYIENALNPIEIIDDYILNALPNLNNYDAIFLHDDPNWFTIYNELNIIKKNNNEFPLVFIYNNRYPFKYRDGYINPDIIPKDYLIKNSPYLPISCEDKEVCVKDGFFHAIHEKTPKNGVLTAMNDFLNENHDIGRMNIQLGEISILYQKSTISKIRIDKIYGEIKDNNLTFKEIPDELIENQLLLNHISQNSENMKGIADLKSELSEKNDIINEYKNKISVHNEELNLKDCQITTINEELNFKNLEIENIESKLKNNKMEILNLKKQLDNANDEIYKKKNYYEEYETNLKNEFTKKERDLKKQIFDKETQLYNSNEILKLNECEINALKRKSTNYSSKLESKEYCISCYKDELYNNKQEIEYLKNNVFLKKIFEPISYIYLILKSKPNEISLNIKLYNALKNSKCFDIGYYLSNNSDISESKWYKYFSPELHYVCNGFSENRVFNKKYFNRKSKKELLEYILSVDN